MGTPVTRVRLVGTIAALAGLYVVAGKLGLLLAFVHPSATAVWPPTGIALAALLGLGYRVWPGVFAGALLVNVLTAGSVATSLGIAAGNTLEGVVGASLVTRWANGPRCCERPRDIFKFAVLAALVSTTVSATCGVTSLLLGGLAEWAASGSIWVTWWLGDAVGALIGTPLLLLWHAHPRVRWNRRETGEIAGLLVALFIVGQIVFGGWLPTESKTLPLDFLCIPILVWAAFRFGPRETATATALLSAVALWGTLRGFGPFVRASPNESLLLLQMFMGGSAVMALAFAVVVAERKRGEETRARLAAIVEASDDAIVGTTSEGLIVTWNRGAERLFGYRAEEVIGQPVSSLCPPDRVGEEALILARLRRGERIEQVETVRRRKDGQDLDVSVTLSPIKDDLDRAIGVSMIARDISERRRAEQQIQSSLREKEVLLREIHHRVKNNLQVIHSLLRMQARAAADARVVALFKESQARVKAMALLHETLWQSSDLSRIDMAHYIQTLTKHLFHSYGVTAEAVTLKLNIAPVSLSMETAITCGLLINELVSNSLTHAFPSGRKGTVTIALEPSADERYRLVIRDDGIGLPEDFAVEQVSSLGWQLVPMLIEQLNGTLERQRGQSTALAVTFSDLQYGRRL